MTAHQMEIRCQARASGWLIKRNTSTLVANNEAARSTTSRNRPRGNIRATATIMASNSSTIADELGEYDCALNATDTGTLGRLKLSVQESGALPVGSGEAVVEVDAVSGDAERFE